MTYACNACFSAEIGDTNYNYAMGLNRLLQVFIYLFIGETGELWDTGNTGTKAIFSYNLILIRIIQDNIVF